VEIQSLDPHFCETWRNFLTQISKLSITYVLAKSKSGTECTKYCPACYPAAHLGRTPRQ